MDWLKYNSVDNSWFDGRDNNRFSIYEVFKARYTSGLAIDSKNWTNFHYFSNDWNQQNGAIVFFRKHFGYDSCLKYFGNLKITNELLISTNQSFNMFKDKKVLVIAGGPSSLELDYDNLDEYDYKFTCNHFFRNSVLSNILFDIILLCQEVNLKDEDLIKYINKFNPLVGFEHSDARRTSKDVVDFAKSNNAKAFLYLTRYFSKLGFGPRLVILAVLFGCKEVHFAGIDGWKNPSRHDHAFENNKPPPPFNNLKAFQYQMVIFWQYIFTLCGDTQAVLNLTESSDFNAYEGIRDRVYMELNK